MSLRKMGHIILLPGETVELTLLHGSGKERTVTLRSYQDAIGIQRHKTAKDGTVTRLRHHEAGVSQEVVFWWEDAREGR